MAQPSDPLGGGSYEKRIGPHEFAHHRMPYDPVISSGTDKSMRVIDGRFAYDYWKPPR